MTAESDNAWTSRDAQDLERRQVQELREGAGNGGLQFQAYLPPAIALWLLDHIAKGTFRDPSEAVFILFNEAKELEPHTDLRQELLKRMILQSADDPRPGIPAEELMARFEVMRGKPKPQPAVWKRLEGN